MSMALRRYLNDMLVLTLVLVLALFLPQAVGSAEAAVSNLSKSELAVIDEQSQKKKVNLIVSTDGEHDDMASMIRFLAMANEFNVKGIVLTSSAAGHHTGVTIYNEPGAEIGLTPHFGRISA